jgi:hypothetical protein
VGAIGMHLRYQLWKTGGESGAMTSLTALPTAEHVCVAFGQSLYRHLQYPNSLVISVAQSCCCCCYVYSRNKRRLEHLERHGAPLREPVERYNHDCKWYFWFCQAAPALQVRLSFPSPKTLGHGLSGFHRPSTGMICADGTGSEVIPSMTSM